MFENGLLGLWFCLLAVFFLVQPGLALDLDPAQCLSSRNYNLIRMTGSKNGRNCWLECVADPGCHMAVVSTPLRGSAECLLVNCLNQGRLSHPRDPSASIAVYPKSPMDEEQRKHLMEGSYVQAEEKYLCYRPVEYGQRPPSHFSYDPLPSDEILIPNFFFYNVSSWRCEGFHFKGSASNGNIFRTVEECESLCGDVKEQMKHLIEGSYGHAEEKFLRCYDFEDRTSFRSCQTGIPRFFYNKTSYRCERFFSGCGSNKNSFFSQEGCEALCNEKYLCYRPVEYGQRPLMRFSYDPLPSDEILIPNFFFYNVSSWRCEGFHFKGSASNGNIFRTVEECESLCGDVKGPQPNNISQTGPQSCQYKEEEEAKKEDTPLGATKK